MTTQPSPHVPTTLTDRDIDALLVGGVDLHVHPGPSPFPRRISIAAAARHFDEAGFRAFVAKSHHHSMVTDTLAVADAGGFDGLNVQVFAGIALNSQVGVLNPAAVELCLKLGGRIVWFPTIASAKHICEHEEHGLNFPSLKIHLSDEPPTKVIDEDGVLAPLAYDVIDLVIEHDAVLACGHLDLPEIDALIAVAVERGAQRILVNHPNYVTGADPEVCARWAAQGAYIEHSLCMYDDRSTFYHWDFDVLADFIRRVGAERTILGSDLGQANNPLPVEAWRRAMDSLAARGIDEAALRAISSTNAAGLLGLGVSPE